MFTRLRETFHRVSWWGFAAVIVAAISMFVFFFGTVAAAQYLITASVFLVLAAIYDNP